MRPWFLPTLVQKVYKRWQTPLDVTGAIFCSSWVSVVLVDSVYLVWSKFLCTLSVYQQWYWVWGRTSCGPLDLPSGCLRHAHKTLTLIPTPKTYTTNKITWKSCCYFPFYSLSYYHVWNANRTQRWANVAVPTWRCNCGIMTGVMPKKYPWISFLTLSYTLRNHIIPNKANVGIKPQAKWFLGTGSCRVGMRVTGCWEIVHFQTSHFSTDVNTGHGMKSNPPPLLLNIIPRQISVYLILI